MTYGLFILNGGEWKFHSSYVNRSDADQELAYVINMLGLTAKVFVRI